MEQQGRLKISDFARLTGSTLKTVLYYHKIGLLPEPERSSGGYRLYGPAELTRMRLIKRLRFLGLDLNRIKDILGNLQNYRTIREVLQSLRVELLNDIKKMEERVAKIEVLLGKDRLLLDEDASPSFDMVTEILGPGRMERYARACPESLEQNRKLHGILDDFQWGTDFQGAIRALAEYWKAHPRDYETALEFGARFERLGRLAEDDPEVGVLPRDGAAFIESKPFLTEMMGKPSGLTKPFEMLYKEMATATLSPAQMRHNRLLRQYFDVRAQS